MSESTDSTSKNFERAVSEFGTELQALVDSMKTSPTLSPYVRDHKLALLDSRFEILDKLLDAGVLC